MANYFDGLNTQKMKKLDNSFSSTYIHENIMLRILYINFIILCTKVMQMEKRLQKMW